MQRGREQGARPSPAAAAEASLSWQNPTLREEGAGALQGQQLLRLAEELRVLWEGAQPLQVRGPERLSLARLLRGTGGPAENQCDSVEPARRGAPSPPWAKKHKAGLREEKLTKPQNGQAKSHKKSGGPGKPGGPLSPGPLEKSKGKRAPAASSSSSRRPGEPRGSRGPARERLHPLLAPMGDVRPQEGGERAPGQQGRWQPGRGCWDPSAKGPVGPTRERGAGPQAAPRQQGAKNRYQRELQLALEALFNTNQKLKEHLSLHLKLRPELDRDPSAGRGSSETQEPGGGAPAGERAVDAAVPAGDPGSPIEAEPSQILFKTDLKHLLSEAENPRHHPTAKPTLKNESQPPPPEAGTSTDLEAPRLHSSESGPEPPTPASLVEARAGWTASRQRRKSELEQALLEQTEHPDMSLEIHYMAELEEERRERRRALLAHLKSCPSTAQTKERDYTCPLGSAGVDEDRQSQMVRDLQQQILEQNKAHQQFLEQARRRLQEFQRAC
ncbi:metalloproteinase inhibitor 2 isoform X1 [Oryctolagus cuniculus]|uniref:metalloproteinase inhibitor 2 isoform X1 n=1 Tax=Oryctolagus cuniculus TaxID=9986 RepID=UPI003879DC13